MKQPTCVCILAVGDELVLGEKVDTNSGWIAAQFCALGVRPVEHRTVPDDRGALADAINSLAQQGDVLVITGGLGPTEDDLTREALGDVVDPGQPLVTDDTAVRDLKRWFAGRTRAMPPRNIVQATRPPSAQFIANPNGTAPGLSATIGACRIFVLPGPPREMKPMFETHVLAALGLDASTPCRSMETVHLHGLGESDAAERLGTLMDRQREPQVGITHSAGVITARIRSETPGTAGTEAVAATAQEVERVWYPYAFGRGTTTLAGAVGRALREAGKTLVTAESCTGGWLAKLIVDEAGASAYFDGGWITYANAWKTAQLGVDPALLETHGAVSEPVARALALGAQERSGASVAVSITGVAGPADPRDETDADADRPEIKRPGLVYIGLAHEGTSGVVDVRRFRFRGDRMLIRQRSALAALQLVRLSLCGEPRPLLWQYDASSSRLGTRIGDATAEPPRQ